jgi:surface protein
MKKSLLTILCTLLSVFSWAQGTTAGDGSAEAYAVLSEHNTVVTFYYDDQKTARGGVDINNSLTNHYKSATTVIFDTSFANYRPESTAYWFNGLKFLETFIGLQYLNTSNVTSFKNMFKGCASLTNLDLSGFDTSKVTDMTQMFEDCFSLKNLNLRSFNTSSVTKMGDMFCGCSSLESVDVSSFNTANVTKMSYMFAYCPSLKTLDLSTFNTTNVTNMEGMFHENSLLTTIYVGEAWSTEKVSTEEHDEAKGTMFHGCTFLVGGAGTPYDSTHVDVTYAHIDGGPNSNTPGYFTRSGDTPWVGTRVSIPLLSWNDNELIMSSTTVDAAIFYSTTATDDNGNFVTPLVPQTLYQQPINILEDCTITACAVKDGMEPSDTIVLNYPYSAWNNLNQAITDASAAVSASYNNPNGTDADREMFNE